jgi:hypothetical protein
MVAGLESRTLPQLIKQFKVKGRYVIKMDCEGGERFLLDDKESIEIIRGCVQFNMEHHRGFGGEVQRWHEWYANFTDTHKLFHRTLEKGEYKSMFEEVAGPNGKWRGEYTLVRK